MNEVKTQCRPYLTKDKVIDIIKDKYDLSNLTEDEGNMLNQPEVGIQLLKHPLLYLIKRTMQQFEDAPMFKQKQVETKICNNRDQNRYLYDQYIYKFM